MTYSYKYGSASHDNPMEFGLYFEETVLATEDDKVTTSYLPAYELRDEFLIIDPDENTDDYNGIIGLYNNDTPGDIFGDISGVTRAGVISAGAAGAVIANGESITIKYYVHPQSFALQFPPNIATSSTSVNATKEIFQCLLNKCQFMTPTNLFRLGYRWADVISRIEYDGGVGIFAGGTFLKVFDTDDDSYYDYLVPHDTHFPFVFTELRVYTEDRNIYIKPSINRGGSNTTENMGENGVSYFNLTQSTALYKAASSGNYIFSIPLLNVSSSNFQIEGRGATSKPSPGDKVIMEVSGYYMPLDGPDVVA